MAAGLALPRLKELPARSAKPAYLGFVSASSEKPGRHTLRLQISNNYRSANFRQ
jgi:hypothetical protein